MRRAGGDDTIGARPSDRWESAMTIRLLDAASTLTVDRFVASAAALVALTAVVAGGLALRRRPGRTGPLVALAAGATGLVVGVLVVATADGGPGTGNGVVGGYVAIVLGLVAVVLGGWGRARTRRSA
jgi:hypothetical protein